ncbi:lipopolysaccharide biosynthesis protein [Draconibacterium halophilum]|uniref:Lipopolysaccharide biosynthesis protein n=1 Tax=Draconibacterium halophilum TaxID=2706887 RepID=A0A6C0R8G5_9BACT|nr:lipopolysaccharide biosynthesis protein [Draconibacterium halophilum]QIA06718.1 lipopolysaccharide biosynthesis protein [Draconibacterium halophilum]
MTTIRKSLTAGIIFTGLAKYSGIIINILIGAILARLLTPVEFGIVAIVTVFITFFNLLSDFGIGPAIVQNKSLDSKDIESVFMFSIVLGILFALVFFFSSSLISQFYNEPELKQISKILALSVLFFSIQIVPKALAQKNLKFKELGVVTVGVQLFSGILAIILAFYGFSYYALVFQSVSVGFFTLISFYWLNPVKVKWKIRKASLKKILGFSTYQFMFNFVNYFSRNADNLLIGKFFSPVLLGFYDKSYRLMMMPVANLTNVITPVLLPVLANHQDNKQLVYNTYLKVIKLLALIGFPLSVFLYYSAGEIITIIYGEQWLASIPVFKILALTVGIQMVLSSSGSVLQAVNRADLLFVSGLISSVVMLMGISYGIFIGKSLESVGYGLIVAFSINFFQGFYFLIYRALKLSLFSFFKVFLFPLFLALGMIVSLELLSFAVVQNIYLSLFFKIVVGGFTFVLLFISKKENRRWIIEQLKRRILSKFFK